MGNSTKDKEKIQHSKLALVLGAGSVKCTAALGLWEVFQRESISIDMVVGCSGGSLFSTAIAFGMDPDIVKETALRTWEKKAFRINYRNLPKIPLPRILGFNAYFGLYKDIPIMQPLEEFFGDLRIEDAHIPLYIIATDLKTGEQVILSKGKVTDAIRASISLPFILSPKEINGQLLIDGGASDPLPLGVAIKEGADIIVAMGHESPYHENLNSALPLVLQLTSILTNNLLKASLAFYNVAHYHETVLIIPKFEERIGAFDTDKIPNIIEMGKRATEEQVPYVKSLLYSDSR